MKQKKYYQLETDDAERSASILIFGDITSWPLLESDVSGYNLAKEVQALDVDSIDVHINSYGGEVAEALAITNTLMRHPAKVTTYVDGFACSAATIIFMAGDERIMSPIGNFLVHPASAYVCGNAVQLRHEADNLDAITEQSVTMYMRSVTKSREELVDLMSEERFLTPEEVLEWGFATKIDDFDEEEETPTQSVRRLVNSKLRVIPMTTEYRVMTEEQVEQVVERLRGELKVAPTVTVQEAEKLDLRPEIEKSFLAKFLNR